MSHHVNDSHLAGTIPGQIVLKMWGVIMEEKGIPSRSITDNLKKHPDDKSPAIKAESSSNLNDIRVQNKELIEDIL